MSKLLSHTYWDGTTVERATARRPFLNKPDPLPQPEKFGPPTALQKALRDFAHFYRSSHGIHD